MLVYGDPKFSLPLSRLFENCRARIQQANLASLEELRSLVILVGQFEQAVADAETDSAFKRRLLSVTMDLTDCLARFFCRKFISGESSIKEGALLEALESIAKILANAPSSGNETVTVKVPEGYAFYALYPEQYCVTTLNWARKNTNCNEALVIGLRSIGTSLSAVVKETLNALGWKARRITVRPHGHPFHRQLTLPAIGTVPQSPVLIVDEGPGISGSSMAAVAWALDSTGRRNVHFFPGHGQEPGSAAAPDVREIWRQTPRYVTQLENVRWEGFSLEQSLLIEAQKFAGQNIPLERIENISGGLWRKFFPKNNEWFISPPQFERMKFLCLGGKGNSVMWKFAGLHTNADGSSACEWAARRLSFLANAGYCPEPLGDRRGFVALPWIEGMRLNRNDASDASVLKRIGNYILDAAQPSLGSKENESTVQRLTNMLDHNTKELLGETAARDASALSGAALEAELPLSYGDGHLAPHEWIRTDNGRILKVDAEGHAHDHTLIGEQSLLWDIAGTFVEWNLTMQTGSPLLQTIERKGMRVDQAAFAFYRAAYAAFRVGLMSLGLNQVLDEGEQGRFAQARGFYLSQLAGTLKQEAAAV
jgi:hypothetical protein